MKAFPDILSVVSFCLHYNPKKRSAQPSCCADRPAESILFLSAQRQRLGSGVAGDGAPLEIGEQVRILSRGADTAVQVAERFGGGIQSNGLDAVSLRNGAGASVLGGGVGNDNAGNLVDIESLLQGVVVAGQNQRVGVCVDAVALVTGLNEVLSVAVNLDTAAGTLCAASAGRHRHAAPLS